MIYWIITIQSNDDVRPIFMTTSYKKAIKKKEQLEKEIENLDYCDIFYYLGSIRLGGK